MKIGIRTDASLQIGIGHVMRCLTLAEELRRRNVQVQFICRAHSGHLADMISNKGFALTLLPAPTEPVETLQKNDDYAAWLGVPQEVDALQTIAALGTGQSDWLIIDHYGLDQEWEALLRHHTRKIMVIDDIANRKHDCDLLLDQNFSQELEKRYCSLIPQHCKLLLGPRYALLKPEYAEYRKIQSHRNGKINKIMIFMGGADNADITGKVLEILSIPELANIEVDVVLGENNPHRKKILQESKNRTNTIVYNTRPHLADLMARADLAIGAGGVTTWERMCLGLPSLVISIADNQKPACQALSDAGFINYVGNWTDLDQIDLKERIISLLEREDYLRFQSTACQTIVDGRGSGRVIESLIPGNKKDFRLRPAREEDVYLYYDWVNDPVVRANALNSEHVSLETHMAWFDKSLSDPDTFMFVLEVQDLPVGQVRFELHEDEATIDYSLDKLVRGRGWGSELVRLGARMLDNIRPSVIQARVKPENKPSAAIFMRLGFDEQPLAGGGKHFSIAVLTDSQSWINAWLPEMIESWLKDGHRVAWSHDQSALVQADFCFYLGYGKIVPTNVLDKYKHNLVVHESDLPKGKGWSPLTWQILEGNNRIPVTLIEADKKVDSGVIYAQERIDLQGSELVEELRRLQATATMSLCEKFVKNFPEIIQKGRKQKGQESFYTRRRPEDSRLNPDKTIKEQFNLLRVVDNAMYPAFFVLHNQRYEITIEKK